MLPNYLIANNINIAYIITLTCTHTYRVSYNKLHKKRAFQQPLQIVKVVSRSTNYTQRKHPSRVQMVAKPASHKIQRRHSACTHVNAHSSVLNVVRFLLQIWCISPIHYLAVPRPLQFVAKKLLSLTVTKQKSKQTSTVDKNLYRSASRIRIS